MGFFDSYTIATSGMNAQRTRINIVSSNIANAQTTHGIDGGPYKKQNVIFEEILLSKQKIQNKAEDLNQKSTDKLTASLLGVGIRGIVESNKEPLLKYEPEHPDANEDGYVAYPNINPVIEMTDMIEAMRSYEANLSSFQTQKSMDTKAIDILRG